MAAARSWPKPVHRKSRFVRRAGAMNAPTGRNECSEEDQQDITRPALLVDDKIKARRIDLRMKHSTVGGGFLPLTLGRLTA